MNKKLETARVKVTSIPHVDVNWSMNKSVSSDLKNTIYSKTITKPIDDLKSRIKSQYWNPL